MPGEQLQLGSKAAGDWLRALGLRRPRGGAAPPGRAHRRGVPLGVDAEVPAAGAAADLRVLPQPRRRPAGLPAGQRGARRQPVVPAAAARRGPGGRAAGAAARAPASTSPRCSPARPRRCGCSPTTPSSSRARAAALAERVAAGGRPRPRPARRHPGAARAAPPGAAAGRLRPTCSAGSTSSRSGTALTDIAVATLQVGLDVALRAHAAGDRHRRRRRPDGPRGHRHGPARRRRDGLRLRRRRPVRAPRPGRAPTRARRPPRPTPSRTRCAGCSASPRPTPPSRWTPTCGPRAGRARWCAASSAFREYYERWVSVWEVQALLRAVPVAGDEELGEDFVALIDPIRYPADGLTAEQVAEIRRIKARVERERLPRGADPATHTKLGRGGLADVEWTVQLLQLQHAAGDPGAAGALDGGGAGRAGGRPGCWTPSSSRRCGRRGSWPPAPATRSSWCAAGRATSCPGRASSWPASPGPAATARTWTPGSSSTTTGGPPGTRARSSSSVFYGQPAAG